MDSPKKSLAAIIIAKQPKMPKNMSTGGDIHENENPVDDLTEIAREILDCVSSKDSKGLARALKNFIYVCDSSEESSEEEEE